jgi:CheY-like chemotaxis protein
MQKKKLHIILIDDYKNGLETFTDLLECWGYAVTSVSKGKEALQLLDNGGRDNGKGNCDLIITNLTELPRIDALCSARDVIPDMTNGEVLSRVREKHPSLPVIVFAPYGSNESAVKARKQGAADYIRKPFSLEDLKSRIDSVLHGMNDQSA